MAKTLFKIKLLKKYLAGTKSQSQLPNPQMLICNHSSQAT